MISSSLWAFVPIKHGTAWFYTSRWRGRSNQRNLPLKWLVGTKPCNLPRSGATQMRTAAPRRSLHTAVRLAVCSTSSERRRSARAQTASMFPSALSLPITAGFHTALDTLSATRSSNQAVTPSAVSAAHRLSTEFHADGFVKWVS